MAEIGTCAEKAALARFRQLFKEEMDFRRCINGIPKDYMIVGGLKGK